MRLRPAAFLISLDLISTRSRRGAVQGCKHLVCWLTLISAAALGCLAQSSVSQEQIDRARAQVTDEQVRALDAKIDPFTGNLSAIWTKILVENNKDASLPKLKGFTSGPVTSACYGVGKNTVSYCRLDDTIYYDKVLLAAFVRMAAAHDHTDGTYAALVSLAHEWGHAIYYRSGETSGILGEAVADCFAGVATRALERVHEVSADNLKDARYTLIMVGDEWENTELHSGAPNILDPGVHGGSEGRVESFDIGYNHGAPACTNKLSIQSNPVPWR
jgi:predicted metalloprotease